MNVLLVSIGIALSLAYSAFAPQEPQSFGAALPSAAAVFETSLAAPITSSATSLTLTANAIRGGGSISGYTCLTIDEGSAQHEVVCGTVSGTSVTSLSRGISFATGTSTVSANQFAHRRGANVKITDFPVIQILKAQANGEDTFPNILKYTSHPTFSGLTDIVDKKYVDDIAFSGAAVIDATSAARGVCELATQVEAASSTGSGSSGILCLPASTATSTWNSATAALRLVMTANDGKINSYFIATSTLYAGQTFSVGAITTTGVSNIASSSIIAFTSSTTPTTTWTKPANLKYIMVEVVGGGGGGGGCGGAGSDNYAGGGGGGGYGKKIIPASALSSTATITVGNGGAGGGSGSSGDSGNSSSFGSHCSASGGTGGSAPLVGGGGGIGSSCDLNSTGSGGGRQVGGNSMMGGGDNSTGNSAGAAGGVYGGGGSGGGNSNGGGAGAVGAVIVTQFFY